MQHNRESETASIAALIALTLAVIISVVAWRVSIESSLMYPAGDLALSALAAEPTVGVFVPSATPARTCGTTAYVTGDMAGDANPATVYDALCPRQ